MFKPFANPEIKQLFKDLFNSLFDESGRGAILIATSHVDNHLTKLIEATLPKDINKQHKGKLFNYPGSLSSFSAKIELAYVFRLIDKNLYESLNALRKIRNDAAHSPSKFELHELNEKLKLVYNLGPGFSFFVKEISGKALIQNKAEGVINLLDASELTEDAKKEIFEKVFNDNEKLNIMEKQVPYWELVYGLSFLCGLIVYHKENIIMLTGDINTLSDLLKDK